MIPSFFLRDLIPSSDRKVTLGISNRKTTALVLGPATQSGSSSLWWVRAGPFPFTLSCMEPTTEDFPFLVAASSHQ